MALNTNIPMGVQPIQLADPLAQYSKVAAIQGAQQQNELARMQMAEYGRARSEEDQLRNYLTQSDLTTPETRAGLARFGKTGLAYSKALTEQDTAKLTQQETAFKVQKAKKEFVAQAQRDTSQNPSDANITAFKEDLIANPLFNNAEKQQMIAGADRILSMPVDQRRAFMSSQGASASELKPTMTPQNLGGTVQIMQTPAFGGTASVVPGSTGAVTMTPAQIEANKIAKGQLGVSQGQLSVAQQRLANEGQGVTYQQDANGNIVALPTKIKAGDVPRGRTVIAPGEGMMPMAGKPSEAEGKELMSLNQQKAVLGGALKQVQANPSAFGAVRGAMGETLGGKYHDTSEEAQARAYAFNVVSSVIHARAGTAQTPGERETLLRFLPGEYDDAKQVENKINAYLKYVGDMESGTTKKRGGGNPPNLPAGGGGVDTSNPLLK